MTSVNSTLLLQTLKTLKKALSLSTSSSFALSCDGNKVWISGSTLGYAGSPSAKMRIGIDCVNGADLNVSTSAKLMLEAVKCFPKDLPVSLSTEVVEGKEFLMLHSFSGKNKVETCDPDAEPALAEFTDPQAREIPSDLFLKGVHTAGFAASTDLAKGGLSGVHFTFSDGSVETAGCDGHRLSELSMDSPEGKGNGAVTIVAKPLQEIAALVNKARFPKPVTILFQDGKGVEVIANTFSMLIAYKQGEQQYPHVKQLFPDSFKESFTVGKKALLKELENVAKVVKDYNNTVILNAEEDCLNLRSHTPNEDGPTYASNVPCHGDGIQIAFNVRYLIECLKLPMFKGGTVRFHITAPTTPAVLTLEGCDNYRYLVMPVQIRS